MTRKILVAAVLFFMFLVVQAKYDEIGRSCRKQIEFFSNCLQNRREWALKREILFKDE